MCSVSICEQEASQIDAVTVTIVSMIVAGTVRTSKILTTNVAGDLDYVHHVET
jgi:hypothetical protein